MEHMILAFLSSKQGEAEHSREVIREREVPSRLDPDCAGCRALRKEDINRSRTRFRSSGLPLTACPGNYVQQEAILIEPSGWRFTHFCFSIPWTTSDPETTCPKTIYDPAGRTNMVLHGEEIEWTYFPSSSGMASAIP